MSPTTTVHETLITTVAQARGALELCREVRVWANIFIHDGAYIPATKKAIRELLADETPETPARGRLDHETETLFL